MNKSILFFLRNFETFLLSALSIVWGLWIGLPFSPLYLAATETAVDPIVLAVLGSVFVLSGTLKAIGLVKHSGKLLGRGSMIGVLGWLWIFWVQVTLGAISPGTVLFPFFAIHNGWLYLKARLYLDDKD